MLARGQEWIAAATKNPSLLLDPPTSQYVAIGDADTSVERASRLHIARPVVGCARHALARRTLAVD